MRKMCAWQAVGTALLIAAFAIGITFAILLSFTRFATCTILSISTSASSSPEVCARTYAVAVWSRRKFGDSAPKFSVYTQDPHYTNATITPSSSSSSSTTSAQAAVCQHAVGDDTTCVARRGDDVRFHRVWYENGGVFGVSIVLIVFPTIAFFFQLYRWCLGLGEDGKGLPFLKGVGPPPGRNKRGSGGRSGANAGDDGDIAQQDVEEGGGGTRDDDGVDDETVGVAKRVSGDGDGDVASVEEGVRIDLESGDALVDGNRQAHGEVATEKG